MCIRDRYEKELAADQGEGHYSLDSSYKVVTDNDKYLCLRIDTTEIMASGAQFVKIFTVDKATGNVISLKDLFANRPDALDKISENIKEQMRSQMAEDENKQYFLDSDIDVYKRQLITSSKELLLRPMNRSSSSFFLSKKHYEMRNSTYAGIKVAAY